MSTEENKALVLQLMHLQENGDLNTADQFIAHNWVNHDPSMPPLQGYEGFKQLNTHSVQRSPAFAWRSRISLLKETKSPAASAFARRIPAPSRGCHRLAKQLTSPARGIFRVVDGRVTDNWVNFDMLGLLQQLGVVQAPGQTS